MPKWMDTKLLSTATQKWNMGKGKILLSARFLWQDSQTPDSYQIPRHFQVFQTSGHPIIHVQVYQN